MVVVTLNERNAAPETCSDEMLIRWIAEGDQLAMRMLFNRRRVALYRWLLQLVGEKALAEDLSFPKIISGRIGGAARTGSGAGPLGSPDLGATHRPAATLSNVKGKRDAPSLPANVTCLHSTQTNRSEPTMCVSGMPGAQSCKCSCEVTFSQPKHSFVAMVATCVYRELRPY